MTLAKKTRRAQVRDFVHIYIDFRYAGVSTEYCKTNAEKPFSSQMMPLHLKGEESECLMHKLRGINRARALADYTRSHAFSREEKAWLRDARGKKRAT